MSSRVSLPRRVLEYDAVSVEILERSSVDIPIRISRGNAAKSGGDHARTGGLPFDSVRHVEDEQMLFRWCSSHVLSQSRGELDVVPILGSPEDRAIEAVVIENYLETEKDFRSLLAKVRDADPEVVTLISYYTDGALIAQQAESVDLAAQLVANGACNSKDPFHGLESREACRRKF